MKNIIIKLFPFDILVNLIKRFCNYFWLAIEIGWQDAYHDLFSVARKLWFFLIFQFIISASFLILPQGIDILQSMIEDLSVFKIAPALWLIVALFMWSFSSEFGARILIYLSDNNNQNISAKRRFFRSKTQKFIPGFQAIMPFVIFILAIVISYIEHDEPQFNRYDITCIIFLLILVVSFGLCLSFYFGSGWLFMQHQRLYEPKTEAQNEIFSTLSNIIRPPQELIEKYELESIDGFISLRKVFLNLFKLCIINYTVALLLFLFIAVFLGNSIYPLIGTTALLVAGIACWLTVFFSIQIFETIKPFKGKFHIFNRSYSSLFFVFLIIISITNNDHPLNIKSETKPDNSPKLSPKEFYKQWLNFRPQISPTIDSIKICNNDTLINYKKVKKYYVLLIAAEGGALRTGCFTTMLLAGIQDSFPDFKNRIFAYSTVSGGTFGANLFNALAFNTTSGKTKSLLESVKDYYEKEDFLAPVAAKLMFGEFGGYYTPFYLKCFDRQVALERAWSDSWFNHFNTKDNPFYIDFYEATKTDGSLPAVFINSTNIESGQRAIISNVNLDESFTNVFDLNHYIRNSISYSTAIGLSARFPLVSPAAKIDIDSNHKIHLADGGYYENRGNTTLIELIESLNKNISCDSIKIIPMVLQTVFDKEISEVSKGVSVFSEFSEIISAIYNVRDGHTQYANAKLRQRVKELGGTYLELAVANDGKQVPMNWTLSEYAVENSYSRIKENLLQNKNKSSEHDSLMDFLKKCGILNTTRVN
jgi:hypothetical protein